MSRGVLQFEGKLSALWLCQVLPRRLLAAFHSPPAAGTAADELARAAAHILRCAAKHSTLQAGTLQGDGAWGMHGHRALSCWHPSCAFTCILLSTLPPPFLAAAWKLLGDVLVLHHAVDPAPHHPTIPAPAQQGGQAGSSDGLEPRLEAWQRRVEAMRQARRAYAKALHLDPAQPQAWQDAAFAYHHQAQVGAEGGWVVDGAAAHCGQHLNATFCPSNCPLCSCCVRSRLRTQAAALPSPAWLA